MIHGIMHKGSGLGNQLHRYVATRIKAQELGVDFSMINPHGFKGSSFMQIDMGKPNDLMFTTDEPEGKVRVLRHENDVSLPPLWEEWDKHTYDPDFNFIADNTIIDGNFEDERYFEKYLPQINEWLKVKEWNILDDVCVIGFRGGEYYTVPELGLPKEYYDRAIKEMCKIGIKKFEVYADDIELAKQFFPNYKIINGADIAWRASRYAKYSIMANSSFYVLPRLLAHEDYFNKAPDIMEENPFAITITPKYFNRYNISRWDYPQFYYKQFKYI